METEWVKIKGKLIYEPKRPGIKKVSRDTPWWLVVNVDNGISEFYSHWIKKIYGVHLHQPMWGNHVTVLDGRVPVKDEYIKHWKKFNGEVIEIEYSVKIEQKWKFFSLPVRSEKLNEIRKELGFFNDIPLHITIGRID